MKVLITGGFGFIGSHIADKFHKEGYDVFIIDSLASGKKENYVHNHRFYKLKVEDPKCEEVFKSNQFDFVIHMAAQQSDVSSPEFSCRDTKTNVLGLINMLNLSAKYKVDKFIFASSASVYGDDTDFPCTENSRKNPLTLFSVNKLLGEYYCEKWSELYFLDTVSLRMSNVYGPRQNPEYGAVIPVFLQNLHSGLEITIRGDGEQLRDFLYVEDVSDAVYKACNIKYSGVLNLSTGVATSVNDLAGMMEKYGTFEGIQYEDANVGEIRNSALDNSVITRLLDWIPGTGLEEGLDKTYENYARSAIKVFEKGKKKKEKERKTISLPEFITSKSTKNRWLPYLENVSAFVLLTLFSLNNANMFVHLPIDLNLFLIVVFTIIYGARQGMISFALSAVSSVLVLLATGRDPMVLVYSTDLYITFAYYVFVSFIIGYIKDKLVRDNSDQKETIVVLTQKMDFLTSLYHDMRTVRNELQNQIVNSEDSLGKIISILQELNTLNPEEVFAKAVAVLEKLMKTREVAIFKFNEISSFARLMACSPGIYETTPKSIRIEENPEIINAIISKDLYVSKELEEGKPLLVMPVLEGDKVVGCILIYTTEFERLTLSYQNYFRIITNLVSSTLSKAYSYAAVIENGKHITGTRIQRPAVFHEMLGIKKDLKKKHGLNYVLLKILLNGSSPKDAAEKIGGVIRDTDFMGMDGNADLFLVLGNTNVQESQFVLGRLAKLMISAEPVEVVEEDE